MHAAFGKLALKNIAPALRHAVIADQKEVAASGMVFCVMKDAVLHENVIGGAFRMYCQFHACVLPSCTSTGAAL